MANKLENKVSTDQPMREAEQSLVSKVNALIDAYPSLLNFIDNFETLYHYVMGFDFAGMQNDIQALKTDMQAVKNKIGL